jgi:3-phosphoshikimate 1-carboxyvinyltransferase
VAPVKNVHVRGEVRVPGDKSISHRALIFGALSRGKSNISRILDSADVQSTAQVLRMLGAAIPPLSDYVTVTGQQSRFLISPKPALDCGNSGTTTRLMAGVVAGAGLTATFTGDASLSRRPMRRIAEPLRAMGADVRLSETGGLPMLIRSGPLRPIEWTSPVASAQVKSAILLAALVAGVHGRVTEPHLSRDHTERMLVARGVDVRRHGNTVDIAAGQTLRPVDVQVPADPSSAAFFLALALLADGGELRLVDVCLNETRIGFLRVLRRMGARIETVDLHDEGGETVGTLVASPSELKGVEIDPDEVPSLIDELPLFACVAARAHGESVVRGASELRVKESDRIATIIGNLTSLGVDAEELEDGFKVRGGKKRLHGAIETRADHRIAMSFGVLGALGGNQIEVDDPACVAVSYPRFWDDLGRVTS